MFQFPGFASRTYVFSARYPIGVGCPIRTLWDQSLLAAPPEFSQRATSFIASWRQGIHRMPFSCSKSNPSCTGTINAKTFPDLALTVPAKPPDPQLSLHYKTPLNPATPSRSDEPELLAEKRVMPGQTTHAMPSRTPRRPPLGTKHWSPRETPSRPARPGAHQNLIHTCQRTNANSKPLSHAPPNGGRTKQRALNQHHPRQHGKTQELKPPGPKAKSVWRWTGSNRRPPACKAGALPSELHPQSRDAKPGNQTLNPWAREDLNLRPHAYQACALTS